MEDKMKQCKDCCRDITEEDAKEYNGYCKKCYKDHNNIKSNNNGENEVASGIKNTAIGIIIIGVICVFVAMFGLIEVASVIIGITSIVVMCRLIYGYGEIIQLLEDIKNK